jgi:D-alanyl-D-alanine carboxypeptidase
MGTPASIRTLAISICLLLSACGASQADALSLQHFVAESDATGVVRGTWNVDELPTVEAEGSLTGTEPMAVDQAMPMASVTKLFVAVVAMQLVEEGVLDLDQTVASAMPAWPRGEVITIRHLLLHQSGMVDAGDDFVAAIVTEPDRVWEFDDVLAYAAAEPPAFDEPGSDTNYSDTNSQVLAAIIEAATDTGIDRHLEDRIIGPLGLVDTFYGPANLQRIDDADFHGYADVSDFYGPDSSTDVAELAMAALTTGFPAASGLWSTADDLLVFAEALFRGDALLTEETRALMIRANDNGYGLGVEHFADAVGHRGTFFGSQSALAYDPESGRITVVLANAFDFSGYDAGPFVDLVEASIEGP